MKCKKYLFFTFIITATFSPIIIYAQIGENENPCSNNTICLDNPLGPQDPDINILIGNIIKAVLGIVGSISLAIFTYGGFIWLTSAGNMEKVQKGKAIFTWGTIGIIIILTAAAFVRFVLGIF